MLQIIPDLLGFNEIDPVFVPICDAFSPVEFEFHLYTKIIPFLSGCQHIHNSMIPSFEILSRVPAFSNNSHGA